MRRAICKLTRTNEIIARCDSALNPCIPRSRRLWFVCRNITSSRRLSLGFPRIIVDYRQQNPFVRCISFSTRQKLAKLALWREGKLPRKLVNKAVLLMSYMIFFKVRILRSHSRRISDSSCRHYARCCTLVYLHIPWGISFPRLARLSFRYYAGRARGEIHACI